MVEQAGIILFLSSILWGLERFLSGGLTRFKGSLEKLTLITGKLFFVPFVLFPLYFKLYPVYDGEFIFNESEHFLRESPGEILHGLQVGAGTSNLARLIAFVRVFLRLDFAGMHLFSTLVGLLAALLFERSVAERYPLTSSRMRTGLFFLFPSIFLFSSLLLKDPFATLGLALFFRGAHEWTNPKQRSWFLGGVYFLLGAFFLFTIRAYVGVIASVGLAIFFWNWIREKNTKLARGFVVLIFLVLLSVGSRMPGKIAGFLLPSVRDSVRGVELSGEEVVKRMGHVKKGMSGGASSFSTYSVEGPLGLLLVPVNMAVVFLQPTIFSANSPLTLLAAIENLFVLGLLLYVWIHRRAFIRGLKRDPLIVFSLAFVFLFFFAFSFVSGNSGTLYRQKTMVLPFLFHLFLATYQGVKQEALKQA